MRLEVGVDELRRGMVRLVTVVVDGNGRPSLVSRVEGLERDAGGYDDLVERIARVERSCRNHLPRVEEGSLPPQRGKRDSIVVEKWKVAGMLIVLVLAPLAAAVATYLSR